MSDIEAAVEKLLASETRLDVARLSEVRNRLEAVWLRALDEYDRSGDWIEEGFASAAAGVRVQCRMDQGAAHAAMRLARKLREMPSTAERFAAGELSREHVAAIASGVTPGRPEFARFEEPLATIATLTTPKGVGE
jgi:hypothetical protein